MKLDGMDLDIIPIDAGRLGYVPGEASASVGPHRFQWTAWPPDSELPVLADNPYIDPEKETP